MPIQTFCVYASSAEQAQLEQVARQGKTPQKVDSLLETRLLFHSATAIGELTYRFGARVAGNLGEKAAREKLAVAIRRIPGHRVVAPTVAIWGEAGILAGLRARLGGFTQLANQSLLNDALFEILGGNSDRAPVVRMEMPR